MSEQNNNCEQCGNNKEPNGECYDCEYTRECSICYERKRWSCDGGDFIEGHNCDHRVCVDCSVRITRCPFCRKAWREEDEEEEEVEEEEEEDIVGEELSTLTADEIRNAVRNLTSVLRRLNERLHLLPERTREGYEVVIQHYTSRLRRYRNTTRFQVRADGDFIQDNDGEWDFNSEQHARAVYDNVIQDILAGRDAGERNLQLTRTPVLDEDDWAELVEDEAYPGITILLEWNRAEQDEGDNPANYCPQCTYALGCCQCPEEQ